MYEKENNNAQIIVLAGQSNAVGVGYVKYLSRHFSKEKTNEFIRGYSVIPINYFSHDIESEGFTDTVLCCSEREKETFGPEIGIAEQLSIRYPDENIFLVKCAVGSTSLQKDWNLKSGKCYKKLILKVSESIRLLEEKGYKPKIRAFCWMQGESDADTYEHAVQYIALYDEMLENFKHLFAAYIENCIFIDGGISEIWDFYKEINKSKISYANSHKNYFYIDTISAGLTTKNEPPDNPDIYHYDSDSVIKLGRLFSEKIVL